MDDENVTLTNYSGHKNIINGPPFEVHVLVVDDDATTLEITLRILTSLNYKAEGIHNPLLALERLEEKEGYFDLIVIDFHMPHMDAFKIKQRIDEHFQLPLIMVSIEREEKVMEKALKSGIVRYIVKPVKASDFKGIWQFAVNAIKSKKPLINNNGAIKGRRDDYDNDEEEEDHCVEDSDYFSWTSQRTHILHHHNSNNKHHFNSSSLLESPSSSSSVTKKTKVVWTNDLQTRFLQAINIIGLENAVPKKILEVMKTPGLTRENVASHLQKYRLFLKRVAKTFGIVMNNVKDKELVLSSLASKYPSLMLKNIQEEFGRIFLTHNKIRSSNNPSITSHQFGYNYSNDPSNNSNLCYNNNHPFSNDYFSTKTNSTTISPNLSQPFCDQIPSSNDTNARFGFDDFDQNNSLINNSNSKYSYLKEGGVFPISSDEDYSANMENTLVPPLNEQNNGLCDEEFCQMLFASPSSHFNGIGTNTKFSHQQDQEVGSKYIDSLLQSNDYFPSFDQFSDQLLENMNLLNFDDMENFKDLEQIPQDWNNDFMEPLFNN